MGVACFDAAGAFYALGSPAAVAGSLNCLVITCQPRAHHLHMLDAMIPFSLSILQFIRLIYIETRSQTHFITASCHLALSLVSSLS
jgi:hypothetical protein